MDGAPRPAANAAGLASSTKGSDSTMWSYAVPSQNENASAYDDSDPYVNGNGHAAPRQDDRKPLSQQSNQARSSPRHTVRSKPSEENAKDQYANIRTDFNDQTEPNGENSDAYATTGSRKRLASRERSRIKRKGSRGAVSTMDDAVTQQDENKWIHRDKLAQIESRELAQLGVRVGSRSSRAGSRRAKSTKTDKSVADVEEVIPDEITEEELAAIESRRLRQVADDEMQNAGTRNDERPSTARSGVSRIPIPTSASGSPEDGESPLELSHRRSGSLPRARRQGSQGALDMAKSGPNSPSAKNSRVVSGNGKTRKPSNARKNSAGADMTRSRSNSASDSPKRPGTSGGRPPTARPEGDPPWISTMYKPDPRLPPDQQMLPTHARRIAEMQRQAEEGSRARQDDRPPEEEYTLVDSEETTVPVEEPKPQSASPVAVEQVKENKRLSQQQENIQKARNSYQQNRASYQRISDMSDEKQDQQWPLRTPSGHLASPPDRNANASPSKQSKHDSGSNEHGGYNLMPTVKQQPKEQDPSRSPRLVSEKEREENQKLAPVNQPVRLEPDDEKEVEKKGCLKCCIVM